MTANDPLAGISPTPKRAQGDLPEKLKGRKGGSLLPTLSMEGFKPDSEMVNKMLDPDAGREVPGGPVRWKFS